MTTKIPMNNKKDPCNNNACCKIKKLPEVTKTTSLSTLIIWNITKAQEMNPDMEIKLAIQAVQEHLDAARDVSAVLERPEERHLACAMLAWQQLGHSGADSLCQFIENRMKQQQCITQVDAPVSSSQKFELSKDVHSASFGSSSIGPVIKLPLDTKIVMRMDASLPSKPCKHSCSQAAQDDDTLNKIEQSCCMDCVSAKRLSAIDTVHTDLTMRAGQLARRESERVELLERAESAWKDLESGYQRRLTLAEEKEDDLTQQIQKTIEERNAYKNACTSLAQQLKEKGDKAEIDRATLSHLEKEVCDQACSRLRCSEESVKGDALLAEYQCKAAQLDRDLQFKEEQARRNLLNFQSDLESSQTITHETERVMRAELSGLRDQVTDVSKQLLEEDAENATIRNELEELREEKNGMLEDLEGCKASCDAPMQSKVDELNKKQDQLSELKDKVTECRCKHPVDVSVEVKRTASLAALCRCMPEEKLYASCSCTSLRSSLLSNLLADLFSGLQSEMDGTGAQMPCQLLKCLEDKHNWDRASVVKSNLKDYFSQLLIGELDIAIANSIENYHAKWVGQSCADKYRMIPDPGENVDEGWQQRAIERRAQTLATKLAEQLFQDRADELTQRAIQLVAAGPPPCECKPANNTNKTEKNNCGKECAKLYPVLVNNVPLNGPTTPANTPAFWHQTMQDVTQLRVQIEDMKKDAIKKEDLKSMEEKITKFFQRASGTDKTNIQAYNLVSPKMGKELKINRAGNTNQSNCLNNHLNKPTYSKKRHVEANNLNKKANKSNVTQCNGCEKTLKPYKKHGQTYAINMCMCAQIDPNKISTQIDEDNSLISSKDLISPISNSVKQTKPINSSLQSHDFSSRSISKSESERQTCASNCKCFHKVPSNTSIDKLLETLTKWKTDLNSSENSNKYENNLCNYMPASEVLKTDLGFCCKKGGKNTYDDSFENMKKQKQVSDIEEEYTIINKISSNNERTEQIKPETNHINDSKMETINKQKDFSTKTDAMDTYQTKDKANNRSTIKTLNDKEELSINRKKNVIETDHTNKESINTSRLKTPDNTNLKEEFTRNRNNILNKATEAHETKMPISYINNEPDKYNKTKPTKFAYGTAFKPPGSTASQKNMSTSYINNEPDKNDKSKPTKFAYGTAFIPPESTASPKYINNEPDKYDKTKPTKFAYDTAFIPPESTASPKKVSTSYINNEPDKYDKTKPTKFAYGSAFIPQASTASPKKMSTSFNNEPDKYDKTKPTKFAYGTTFIPPASTASEYMGEINLDKSNEDFCKCESGKSSCLYANEPFRCLTSGQCNCETNTKENIQNMDMPDENTDKRRPLIMKYVQKNMNPKIPRKSDEENVGILPDEEEDEKGGEEEDEDCDYLKYLKSQRNISPDQNELDQGKTEIEPCDCGYDIKFLGVTLTDVNTQNRTEHLNENMNDEKRITKLGLANSAKSKLDRNNRQRAIGVVYTSKDGKNDEQVYNLVKIKPSQNAEFYRDENSNNSVSTRETNAMNIEGKSDNGKPVSKIRNNIESLTNKINIIDSYSPEKESSDSFKPDHDGDSRLVAKSSKKKKCCESPYCSMNKKLQTNEDKGLDAQSFKEKEESCVCCDQQNKDDSNDLEKNAFQLLEEHLKKKLEEFKQSSCNSTCIPPEEENKLFTTILTRVKQLINDSTNKITCNCSNEVENSHGSWNRAYGLLQEYLKTKIKRVQCDCVSVEEKNDENVLPDVLDKVCNLIENDFQRLKDVCGCTKDQENDKSKNKQVYFKEEVPERDTNRKGNQIKGCKSQNPQTAALIKENISLQVPSCLEMANKSCNPMETYTRAIQTLEKAQECLKSFVSVQNANPCINNNKLDAELLGTKREIQPAKFSREPYVGFASECVCKGTECIDNADNNSTQQYREHQCCNVLENKADAIINGDVTESLKKDHLCKKSLSHCCQKIVNNSKSEKNLSNFPNKPYIGYTINCSCDVALGTCVCTKSIIKNDDNLMYDIWKKSVPNDTYYHKVSYIMKSNPTENTTNNNDLSEMAGDLYLHNLLNHKTFNPAQDCETEVSLQDVDDIVILKNSRDYLDMADTMTNTFDDKLSNDSDYSNTEAPLDWCECCSHLPPQDLNSDQLKHSIFFPIPLENFDSNLESDIKKSITDTAPKALAKNCNCDMVPICHVKMLVENIENKLVGAKCTCDSMIPKVCPIHSTEC